MSEFGRFVLRRLNEVGLSQAEAVRRGTFTRQSLGNWINGHVRTVELRSVISLASVLQVSPYHLLQLVCREMGTVLVPDSPVLHRGDHTRFVDDLAVPDNTIVHVGERFAKGWRLQNTGRMEWVDRRLECVDVPPPPDPDGRLLGYLKPVERSIEVPRTAPGATVDLHVEFVAPDLPGTVRSTWKLIDADGGVCFPGHSGVYCQVRVMSL